MNVLSRDRILDWEDTSGIERSLDVVDDDGNDLATL